MRFHRIKLRNLNSLYGDHTIDFDTDMRDAPMFLIMGPTGAGKSTILDAICLALFGQTPRLDRKTGKPETDVSHILSQGTAESAAEVEFSVKNDSGAPERHLAVWSCRRAYDDPAGAVQKPERSLYRFKDSGEMQLVVSDHREKFFQSYFDDVLADLTVEDFQRTILLAQGEFSAFLNAGPKQKAAILERLTNTDLYKQIGSKAAHKKRAVDAALKSLDQTLADLTGGDPVDPALLSKTLKEHEVRVAELSKQAEHARADRDWLARKQQLKSELERAETGLNSALETRTAQASLFDKRDADLLVRKAEAPLLLIRSAETTLAELRGTLPEVAQSLQEYQQRLQELERATATAETELADTSKAFTALKPELERAAELYTKLATAESELAASEERLRTVEDSASQLRNAFETCQEEFSVAEKITVARLHEWESLGAKRQIIDVYPSLIATYEHAVAPISDELSEITEKIEETTSKIESLESQIAPISDALKAASKSRASQQSVVTRIENEITTDGIDDLELELASVRVQLEGDLDAMKSLGEASLLLDRIIAAENEQSAVRDQIADSHLELEALVEEQKQAKEIESARIETLRASEDAVRLNERLRALSELRTQLNDGEPCPLCGSPLHPFSASDELQEHEQRHVEEHERLTQNRDDAKSKLQEANRSVQRLAAKYVSRMTAKQHDESQLISINERLEEDRKVFAHALERSGFNPLEAFELKEQTKLARLAETREGDISTQRARLEKLREFRDRLAKSRGKLEVARAEQERLRSEISSSERELSETRKELSRQQTERAELIAKRKSALFEIRSNVTSLEFEFDSEASNVPERLTSFYDEVQRLSTSHKESEEKKARARQKLDEAKLKFDAAREHLASETGNVSGRRESRDALRQSTAALLNGRNPRDVRQEFEAKLTAARETLDRSRKMHSECDAQRQKGEERHAQVLSQIERNEARVRSGEEELAARLGELGFERHDIESRLLTTEERAEVDSVCRAIENEISEHKTRVKTVGEQLDAHKTDRSPPEKEMEAVSAELVRLESQLADATRSLGASQEKWRRYEEMASREAELRSERASLSDEAEIWNAVYRTIGVGDGQRFQEFAQSLNLRGLVERANARLEHLYPRYQVAVAESKDGAPTMDFIVRDRYQANSERPLTTLSGGETFLVSLALALALADYRKVSMPIETLLLDEGFGTLDEDALHMALTTLHQLHRDGARQIGIISHVASLKELVDSRIVIEPRGHGRSEIRFEFGPPDPAAEAL